MKPVHPSKSAARNAEPMSLRQFFRQSGAMAAAAVAAKLPVPTALAAELRKTPAQSLTGTQLYGWGQYYQRDHKDLSANMGEVLSAVRDCGFDYAESSLDSARPEKNAEFAELLKKRGLKPVSFYTGGGFHTAELVDKTVPAILAAARVSRDAGFHIINCNPDPIGRAKTDAELEVQARGLKQLGEGLQSLGMKLGIHHHTPEMRDEAKEFHSNFRKTAPGVVGFCFDVHWVFRGGMAPMAALKDYGDRVVSWHLRQSRERIWWEDLDDGEVNYAEIAKFAQSNKLPGFYTVELALEGGTKITRGVVENHRRSRDYVRRVFGA